MEQSRDARRKDLIPPSPSLLSAKIISAIRRTRRVAEIKIEGDLGGGDKEARGKGSAPSGMALRFLGTKGAIKAGD